MSFAELLSYFFTHKDFLPPANELPGTMFTPLHFVFAGILLVAIIFGALWLAKKDEKTIRIGMGIFWAVVTFGEAIKIVWESTTGNVVGMPWGSLTPLYPCSIFMYAMPFALFFKGKVRYAACGYVCTLGMLGGSINFVYPATVLDRYSCISLAGFQTFFYHGALVFCTIVMLKSGYHSFKNARKPIDLLLPAIPALIVSIPANLMNFSPVNSDFMFFKMRSLFFAPIGEALPAPVCVIIVYIIYLIIHAAPYLPFYFKNRRTKELAQ
ncbi:MAG: YwaF family protein [Clostridia bacterium]|nr:YwaF family protein [Clostridia bacterium]